MTREEEIDAMARRYTDNIPAEIDRFCKENMYSAYVVGAMWADEHPKNVWHDVSEEPKEYPIIYQDEFSDVQIMQFSLKDFVDGWEDFKGYECVTRWAYISDLLPKGGEK